MKAFALVCLAALLVAPGCVFWQIRDGVNASMQKLDEVESRIQTTNASLDTTVGELRNVQVGLERLDRTNNLIGKVESGLGRIDRTNESLGDVDERLKLLKSIDVSLARLDTHLASVRKTIGAIDSMIPFLDLGSTPVTDAPSMTKDPAPADAAKPAPPEAAQAGAPADPAASQASSASRRDALAGTWLVQYPEPGEVWVLLESGRFLRERRAATPPSPAAAPVRDQGGWARDGKRLSLQSDPLTIKNPDGTTRQNASTLSGEIVAQSTRSLTLRLDAGGLMVLSKP